MDFTQFQWALTFLIVPSVAWLAKGYKDTQEKFLTFLQIQAAAAEVQRVKDREILDKLREAIEANTRSHELHAVETQTRAEGFLRRLEQLETRRVG